MFTERQARQSLGRAAIWQDADPEPPHLARGTREMEPVKDDRDDEIAELVHDLKNPLATIVLEAQLLDDKLVRGEYRDLRGSVARIHDNARFLDRMIHDLLDCSEIEAGVFELRRVRTELRELLAEVIERAVPTRERERVYLDAPSGVTLAIDDLRIARVVGNLLSNALKYAPRCTGVVVRLEVGPSFARVSVIDAGHGLSAAEASTVFEKYRRADTAQGHEGSGLGLYVSRKIIEAHGGRIDVDAIRAIGTRFFFDLPL